MIAPYGEYSKSHTGNIAILFDAAFDEQAEKLEAFSRAFPYSRIEYLTPKLAALVIEPGVESNASWRRT